jgi:hypothetical protein
MWYISLDDTVTSADLAWGFRYVACCMEPGAASSVTGSLPWPDVPPYNTLGETYYIAIVADDRHQLAESDEQNNVGAVWPITLARNRGDRAGGDDSSAVSPGSVDDLAIAPNSTTVDDVTSAAPAGRAMEKRHGASSTKAK